MKPDEIRNLLRATPFRPFKIFMVSEKMFSIPHPEFALLTPPGRTLVIYNNEDEALELLDVALIARAEVPSGTPARS